jgi:catalase
VPQSDRPSTEQAAIKQEENFRQPGALYRSLSTEQQDHLIKNLAGDLGQVRSQAIKETMVSNFYKADKEYGTRLAKAVGVDVKAVEKLAANN